MAPRPKTGAIDLAEAWVIENITATYRDAACMFNVSHNQIRARIVNKYGSLGEARNIPPAPREPGRIIRAVRRCLRCGVSSNIEPGLRMCPCCRKEVAKIHEGGV